MAPLARPEFLARIASAKSRASAMPCIFCDVELGLVQRQRLDDGRVLDEDFVDLLTGRLIDLETVLYRDQVGTLPLCRDAAPMP